MRTLTLWLHEGGGAMYVLLAIHAGTWAVVLERLGVLLRIRWRNRGVTDAVAQMLRRAADAADSIRLPRLRQSAGGAVLYGGLLHANRPQELIRQAMMASRHGEVVAIRQRAFVLKWLASIAPLVGFFGTVVGWVPARCSGFVATPATRAAALAAGIAESFTCTAFGLFVAATALVGYALVRSQGDRAIEEIDLGVTAIMNEITALGPSLRLFGMRTPVTRQGYRDPT